MRNVRNLCKGPALSQQGSDSPESSPVQTVEGKAARAPVASELAAMFCHSVLPTLQKHYLEDAGNQEQVKAYERKCKKLAAQLKLEKCDWPLITMPFFISMDWDSRHTWVRQVLATPRQTEVQLETLYREALLAACGEPDAAPVATAGQAGVRDADNRGGISAAVTRNRHLQDARDKQRATYRAHHGRDCELYAAWDWALKRPSVWGTLIPRQFMPLYKISPDMHCPVEHMVGTIKLNVREALLATDLTLSALWQGVTYQKMLVNAVESRGNGDNGRYHISRSIEKQKLICQILAAAEDEELELQYVFGKKKMLNRVNKEKASKRKVVHLVKGTAGRWIKDSKWT